MGKDTASVPRSKRPELLQEMTDVLTSAFEEAGKTKEQAAADAMTAIEALIYQLGGQLIYFPFGAAFNKARRDKRILEEINGNNTVSEVARRHKLSMQAVYRIVKKTEDVQ